MSALFLNILNLVINASWLILAVIVARLLLKKAPKWISCLLWGLVAVRLLCPFSLESALSLLPSGKVVPENIEMVQDPHIDSGVRLIDNAVNPVIERSFSPDAASSANPMQVAVFVASVIWLTGMAAMFIYALISFLLLKRKVRASAQVGGRIRECDEVDSPFILGIFRPVIYVPSGIGDKTLELVIAHEEVHLKRLDHWWKPFGFLLLAVYWFNPLCWVAYILLCRDIEAACDEKVIRDKDRDYMAAYSQALLDCSVPRRIIAACPLAFGGTSVKERVKGVLNYKKPAFWVIVVSVVACIIVAVCFMTNPKNRYYDITVKISAGSEMDTVWYSDEEVSPKGNTLRLDTGDFYRGTLILQAMDGSTGVVEQTARLQPNTPVTFQVQPGVWYRVGLRMGMNTGDNDVSLKVRVKNAEVRIASEDNRPERAAMDRETLEAALNAKEEKINAEMRAIAEQQRLMILENGKEEKTPGDPMETPAGGSFTPAIGLAMYADNVSSAGCTLVFEQSGGNATGKLETGQWYELQVKNGDGEWIDDSARDIERSWEDIAYTIKMDGTTELPVNWEQDYDYLQDGHYRIVKKVMDYRSPGDYDEYDVYAEFDIGNGAASTESVADWMEIALPRGYSISNFRDDIGWMGGSLILPKSYEVPEWNNSAPLEWQYSGLITRIPANNTDIEYFRGIPKNSGIPVDNHTIAEYISTIGLERSTNQWPALMLKVTHDLYTQADVEMMKRDGIDTEGKMELSSDYWEFWFVKEGEETYYILTLSAKEFSEKEATNVALGVSIK